jgi:hypothetical protein
MQLKYTTSGAWLTHAVAHFDDVLIDHEIGRAHV